MTDYERFSKQGNNNMPAQPAAKHPVSARAVIDALAVAAILWVGNNIQSQNVQLARLQTQLADVQASLAGMPHIQDSVTTVQAEMIEMKRRVANLELQHTNVKGWTR